MSADLVVRPATESDLGFLVQMMRTAATSHLARCVWDVLLDQPPKVTDALMARVAASAAPHWCHVSRFFVAVRDNRPVGALSGFATSTEGSNALEAVLTQETLALDLPAPALQAVLERAAVLRDGTPRDFANAWGIENVAVVPDQRGRGVVDALFHRVLELGRSRRHDTAQILCLNGNGRAEATWRRLGFTIRADHRDDRFQQTFGCAGVKLLTRGI